MLKNCLGSIETKCSSCPYGEYHPIFHPYFSCNYPNIAQESCVIPMIEYENREYENPKYKHLSVLEYIQMKEQESKNEIYRIANGNDDRNEREK